MNSSRSTEVLVLGINPSGKKYRKNCSLDRLHKWMAILGYTYYSFSNVIPYTGKYKKNMVDINALFEYSKEHDKIISLGRFVSDILNEQNIDHFLMPHPSPLNRQLNDPMFEEMALKKCSEYLRS